MVKLLCKTCLYSFKASNYHTIQQLHSWAFILGKLKLMITQIPVDECLIAVVFIIAKKLEEKADVFQWVTG